MPNVPPDAWESDITLLRHRVLTVLENRTAQATTVLGRQSDRIAALEADTRVAALQELVTTQQAEIDDLRDRVEALEAR